MGAGPSVAGAVAVRYDACYAPHPFMIPAVVFASGLSVGMFASPLFFRSGGSLAVDDAVNAVPSAIAHYGLSGPKDVMRRFVISFSEGMVPPLIKLVVLASCALATTFGFVCYVDVAFAALVALVAVELALVCETPWYSFEHEASTAALVTTLTAAALAASAAYVRVDPRYPPWLFAVLIALVLAVGASFAAHPLVVRALHALPQRCLPRGVQIERERLSYSEAAFGTIIVATAVLV